MIRIVGALIIALLSFTAAARVALEDRQGARIDLENSRFRDESGNEVPLGRFFHAGKPVVLALVYYGCPSTCTVLLNNFVDELNLLSPSTGTNFDVVAVSVDASETPALAQEKKQSYLKLYHRLKTQPGTEGGWHFLTGSSDQIHKLSDTLGYFFEKQPSGLIVHPAALFFMTENGVLAKTLTGVEFSKREILAAYYESSHGLVDRAFSRFLSLCNSYMAEIVYLNSVARWLLLLSVASLLSLGLFLNSLRRRTV